VTKNVIVPSTWRNKSEIRSTKEAPRIETNRGQNKFQTRKIQNEESKSGLFGTLHLFLVI
jgi:hypothetical protein